MVWRSVMISRPARLRREHYSLAIDQEETAFVPFEDIAVIVLNHREITLTHPVLSACAEYGIGLFATGANHQPAGVFLPFLPHSRTTRMMRKQLGLGKPAAKQAWAALVRRKIENQAACLKLCGKEGMDRLASYARRVRSGDPDNLEAQAAAFYFAQLFGSDFNRAEARWTNAALDYGYAVLRGAIARGLVAHGLHPTVGLFHDSEQNAFNLADDLIEPFRPIVDLHVAKHPASTEGDLIPTDKQALVALLNVDVGMPQGRMSVLSAIEYAVESLVRVYEDESRQLHLPALIGLTAHRLEY
ncbi:type II CRISPR-associated endonuclease Cas1 [Sulfuricystis multivorans]|uniref:type II CRISPR-associated endonuclease Cas1 n=1 Tax=Sulfuricystis multivorans TaxID=2211108 RepID=UPI0024DFC071|nr:type II CRISPR-associated endonuclease Cas1 [Sulfuricystis multivorans]